MATREGLYRENLLTDKAIQFIDVMDGKDKPYFLYLATARRTCPTSRHPLRPTRKKTGPTP